MNAKFSGRAESTSQNCVAHFVLCSANIVYVCSFNEIHVKAILHHYFDRQTSVDLCEKGSVCMILIGY